MTPDGCIMLASGISIKLTRLNQVRTYDGLIEGVPCRSVNDSWLAELRQSSPRSSLPRYLVPPKHTRRWQSEDPDKGWFLPDKKCLALFCGPSLRDDHDFITELEVAFFQEQWAMPFDTEIVAHIQQIDWPNLARESCWT